MIKILLIDDDEDFVTNLKELFELVGYEIEIACDGEVGFQLLDKIDFHLIICDMHMPKMSGLQFMEKLLTVMSKPYIPVIFHSANLTEIEKFKLEALKSAAILQKSTPFQKLNGEVLKILSKIPDNNFSGQLDL
jgi:CheY-like chemotaxis protein